MIILLSPMAQADVVFPPLTASDLNERSLNLPADFPGKPNIVFIAYKLEQQPNVNAWVEQLDLRETGGQAWVELPVVGRGAVLFRSFVDNGMRLGISGRGEIYVALVDPDGTIHALVEGDVTEAKVEQLRAAYP